MRPVDDNVRRQRRPLDQTPALLAKVEAAVAAGRGLPAACADAGISLATYYRWRAYLHGMKLPLQKQPSQKQRKILQVAKQVFLSEGYATTLETIAKAAHVSRQTVYNQFESKERLFSEVIQSLYEQLTLPLLTIDLDGEFTATLMSFGRHFLQMALDPDSVALQRIALGEFRQSPDLSQIIHQLRESQAATFHTDHVASYLRKKMKQGVIATRDPILCAEAFTGSFTLHARHRLIIGIAGDSAARLEHALALSVELFARGIGYVETPVRKLDRRR
jgi:TetR/AcrR family transcriptional repressor of mexJK operon